jgi:hypothetical protein
MNDIDSLIDMSGERPDDGVWIVGGMIGMGLCFVGAIWAAGRSGSPHWSLVIGGAFFYMAHVISRLIRRDMYRMQRNIEIIRQEIRRLEMEED